MANEVEFEPWFQLIWGWIGDEIFDFGIRWLIVGVIMLGITYLFGRKYLHMRQDIDSLMEHIGVESKSKIGLIEKVFTKKKHIIHPPPTKTWINRKDTLALIGRSSIALRNSPRRKKPAKTAIQKMLEQSTSGLLVTQIAEPSGEDIYTSKLEGEVATGLLYQIIKKHPDAKKGDKYSQEIIVFELCQMALKGSTGHDI